MQLGAANVRGRGGGVGQHSVVAVLSEEGRVDRIVRECAREHLAAATSENGLGRVAIITAPSARRATAAIRTLRRGRAAAERESKNDRSNGEQRESTDSNKRNHAISPNYVGVSRP